MKTKVEKYDRNESEQSFYRCQDYNDENVPVYRCQNCGEEFILDSFNYCPNCGRKIDWRNHLEEQK